MDNRISYTSLLFNVPSESFIFNWVEDVGTIFVCCNQEIDLKQTGNLSHNLQKAGAFIGGRGSVVG
jgi:hypothetical protein